LTEKSQQYGCSDQLVCRLQELLFDARMPQAREMKRIEEKPMRTKHRRAIAFALSLLLVWPNLATTASPAGRQARPSLADLVNESYLKLLEIAPSAQFTGKELEDFKKQLERKKEN
jgi:hypothetical protein